MRRESDILPLTLTELSLFVVVTLILLMAMRAKQTAEVTQDAQARLEKHRSTTAEMEARTRRLEEENHQLQLELDTFRRESELRSRAKPSCIETRATSGFLFATTIGPTGEFLLGGRPFTERDLLSRFSAELESADAAGCVHSIEVSHSPQTTLQTYLAALRRLDRHFYVKRQ